MANNKELCGVYGVLRHDCDDSLMTPDGRSRSTLVGWDTYGVSEVEVEVDWKGGGEVSLHFSHVGHLTHTALHAL